MDRRDFLGSSTALGALAMLPAAARAATAGAGDAALQALFDRIFNDGIQDSPQSATQLGLDKGANAALKSRLDDPSLANRARGLARTRQAITALTAIDPATLSPASKLDREVVLYSLRQREVGPAQFGVGSPQRPYPVTQQQGAYFGIPDFLNSTHVVKTADDAEAYLARLADFARVLDAENAVQQDAAKRGLVAPAFALDLALGQMAALRKPAPADSSLVTSLVRRATAAGLTGDYGARAARIVTDSVYPALDRQIALVTTLRQTARADVGLWAVPGGDALYAAALASATTTDFTPDQVHQIGLDQVAEISATLDSLLKAQGLTQGSVSARLDTLNTTPAQLFPDTAEGRAALLASLNGQVRTMQARLPALFINPPDAPLEIRSVPVEIQDGASNGYYYRAALDGSRPAIYWINLKHIGDWPKYGLPTLTHHEGVPGHHLQISIAQAAPGPLIRKTSFFNAYTEGWALYAEQLAEESGVYDQDPLGRIGFYQSLLFRACRLVVDTGIHAKRWSREKAIAYMVEVTGFPPPRATSEINRYCTMPGQACSYKLGHVSWLRARAKAKAILGARFDVRQFHEVLRSGAVPLVILERLVEERARAQV
ncbi:DUF885 family protein [Sphingomonas sp.]|jgi:uncharacterized protein (DUF885 family)|uniref:DUF885 domain-containing protein n=1 Tax=Sphingomonas sp. TaxID=28214 RepID=UPI003563E807